MCLLSRQKNFLHLPVTCSQSAAVPAPQQKMFGASLWIFSQFLSATTVPAVALVSAARAIPSYTHSLVKAPEITLLIAYLENNSTNCCSCFCKLEFLIRREICLNSFISETVFVVESSKIGLEVVHIVEFHD